MRNIGRQRGLRGRAAVGLAAMVALAVGGSLAASQAVAAPRASASSSNGHCNSSPTITVAPFGSPVPDTPYSSTPEQTFRYTLTNCQGMQIQLLTYGATTQSITVPDRHGHRIAKGAFPLNGTTYTLPINNGPNSLHGGFVGFGNHIWHAAGTAKTPSSVSVTLKLVSPNGDEGSGLIPGTKVYEANCSIPANPLSKCTGYPAQLTVWVTFTLDNHNRYWLTYKAHNDDSKLSTVLNLTNHSYFNLAGEASGSALNQDVQINANAFTPTDSGLIPTGQLAPVAGTPFDFRHLKPIFPSISDCTAGVTSLSCVQLTTAHGFDHNWVLNSTGPHFAGLNLAARALDPC